LEVINAAFPGVESNERLFHIFAVGKIFLAHFENESVTQISGVEGTLII